MPNPPGWLVIDGESGLYSFMIIIMTAAAVVVMVVKCGTLTNGIKSTLVCRDQHFLSTSKAVAKVNSA